MHYSLSYDNCLFFFFNDTATTEIYTLPLHDALPIYPATHEAPAPSHAIYLAHPVVQQDVGGAGAHRAAPHADDAARRQGDRKSTRLNSSHANISYAVFCLKKKNNRIQYKSWT